MTAEGLDVSRIADELYLTLCRGFWLRVAPDGGIAFVDNQAPGLRKAPCRGVTLEAVEFLFAERRIAEMTRFTLGCRLGWKALGLEPGYDYFTLVA